MADISLERTAVTLEDLMKLGRTRGSKSSTESWSKWHLSADCITYVGGNIYNAFKNIRR